MGELLLRPADTNETERLAAVKSDYVRSLYRGFLSAEYLRGATREFYLPEITWMMQDKQSHVDAMEIDGETVGYVVYGVDPSNPDCGLIREAGLEPVLGRREKDALVRHAIAQLTDMGFQTINLWVLKDNFRVRFLFESLGFRHDGMVRVEPRDNLQLNIARYVYRIPVKDGGLH